MKQASGNDSLVARGLYQSEREFRPTHQFWFQSNYRPGFDSTDSGNKRRYVEIPFDNDLTTDPLVKFDGKLKITMRKDKDFLKAVLAWAVAGAVEWHQHGLQIPESVQAATAALFAHNDFLNDFVREMCVIESGESVLTVIFLLATPSSTRRVPSAGCQSMPCRSRRKLEPASARSPVLPSCD